MCPIPDAEPLQLTLFDTDKTYPRDYFVGSTQIDGFWVQTFIRGQTQ
jgi:hypothetical protein